MPPSHREPREVADSGPESSVEKFCERAIFDRLELAHVDVVLADKWLDFTRTPVRVFIGGIEPVEQWLRLDPLLD
jgi:hypothetical protein